MNIFLSQVHNLDWLLSTEIIGAHWIKCFADTPYFAGASRPTFPPLFATSQRPGPSQSLPTHPPARHLPKSLERTSRSSSTSSLLPCYCYPQHAATKRKWQRDCQKPCPHPPSGRYPRLKPLRLDVTCTLKIAIYAYQSSHDLCTIPSLLSVTQIAHVSLSSENLGPLLLAPLTPPPPLLGGVC